MLTDDKIIAIFCLVDYLLKGIGHREDIRTKVSDSEVITTAIVSAPYLGGHCDNGRQVMAMTAWCRRCWARAVSAGGSTGWSRCCAACSSRWGSTPSHWRGRHSSMRRYFYGVNVQVLTTADGIPVEFCFVPGSENDVQALKKLPMAVAPESSIFADSAYTDYQAEDDMMDADGVKMMVHMKRNSKRPDTPDVAHIKNYMRKRIETTFSEVKALFLRKVHAVTFKGFLIKVLLFIMATTLNKLTK